MYKVCNKTKGNSFYEAQKVVKIEIVRHLVLKLVITHGGKKAYHGA